MIDPESLEALEAVVDAGSLSAAAGRLNKAVSAVGYHLRRLEEQIGVPLLDRSGYRLALTPEGKSVLAEGRPILERLRALGTFAERYHGGWEHQLRIVYDGALPAEVVIGAINALVEAGAPTHIELNVAYLGAVPFEFDRKQADVMIATAWEPRLDLIGHRLATLGFSLCCSAGHPLAMRTNVSLEELQRETELIIPGLAEDRSFDARHFRSRRLLKVSDFNTKLIAIRRGLGFGWLPDYLASDLIRKGNLARVRLEGGNSYELQPVFALHRGAAPGRARQMLLDILLRATWDTHVKPE